MTELKLCPFCGGDGSLSLNIQCKVVSTSKSGMLIAANIG